MPATCLLSFAGVGVLRYAGHSTRVPWGYPASNASNGGATKGLRVQRGRYGAGPAVDGLLLARVDGLRVLSVGRFLGKNHARALAYAARVERRWPGRFAVIDAWCPVPLPC